MVHWSAPGPHAAEHGVHDGPGAVFFSGPQVHVDPQRDHRGRVPENELHLLDARASGDERRGEEVPQVVRHELRQHDRLPLLLRRARKLGKFDGETLATANALGAALFAAGADGPGIDLLRQAYDASVRLGTGHPVHQDIAKNLQIALRNSRRW